MNHCLSTFFSGLGQHRLRDERREDVRSLFQPDDHRNVSLRGHGPRDQGASRPRVPTSRGRPPLKGRIFPEKTSGEKTGRRSHIRSR